MSIILAVPLAIAADILSPKVRNWLDSRNKEKSLDKQWHEENKKEPHEEIKVIKYILINAFIFNAPFILVMMSSLLKITKNTVFMLLIFLSVIPSIYLFIRLIQQFKQFLKHKRENKNDMQEETEKIKNNISVGIISLPFILILVAALLDIHNRAYEILYYISFFISDYFVIRSIIRYVQLLNNKKKLEKNSPISPH